MAKYIGWRFRPCVTDGKTHPLCIISIKYRVHRVGVDSIHIFRFSTCYGENLVTATLIETRTLWRHCFFLFSIVRVFFCFFFDFIGFDNLFRRFLLSIRIYRSNILFVIRLVAFTLRAR